METYTVKLDKLAEYAAIGKKYLEWIKKRPDLTKELKSWKLLAHALGGNVGGYVEMWEYENLADAEKAMNRLMQDKEFMTDIYPQFMAVIMSGTYSINVWNPVA